MDINLNQKVKLVSPLPYLKTADNMPMLRPPDLVAINEEGEVVSIRSHQTVEVKFEEVLSHRPKINSRKLIIKTLQPATFNPIASISVRLRLDNFLRNILHKYA